MPQPTTPAANNPSVTCEIKSNTAVLKTHAATVVLHPPIDGSRHNTVQCAHQPTMPITMLRTAGTDMMTVEKMPTRA
jgi:hypothetical protein